MARYILINEKGDEYYLGKTYVYQGGLFPCYCKKSDAKRYKSRKVAENACEKLNEKIGDDRFEVIEIEED